MLSRSLQRIEQELSVALTQDLGIAVHVRLADEALPVHELSNNEKEQLFKFKTGARRSIWLCGRNALKRLLVDTGGQSAQVIEFPNARYSISHCNGISVALGLGDGGAFGDGPISGLGVDLELNHEINAQHARYFLTEGESTCLEKEYLLRMWTVKEAIFKADQDNSERQFSDYELLDPQQWTGQARLAKETMPRIRYSTIAWQTGFLSAALFHGCAANSLCYD